MLQSQDEDDSTTESDTRDNEETRARRVFAGFQRCRKCDMIKEETPEEVLHEEMCNGQ